MPTPDLSGGLSYPSQGALHRILGAIEHAATGHSVLRKSFARPIPLSYGFGGAQALRRFAVGRIFHLMQEYA